MSDSAVAAVMKLILHAPRMILVEMFAFRFFWEVDYKDELSREKKGAIQEPLWCQMWKCCK